MTFYRSNFPLFKNRAKTLQKRIKRIKTIQVQKDLIVKKSIIRYYKLCLKIIVKFQRVHTTGFKTQMVKQSLRVKLTVSVE